MSSSVLIPTDAGVTARCRRAPALQQGGKVAAVSGNVGTEPDRLADLGDGTVEISFRLECMAEIVMRPGMIRRGPDRRTEDVDGTVQVPLPSTWRRDWPGPRVAGFDPEGLAVGRDGTIPISLDLERVAESVIVRGVAGPATD